MMKQTPSAISPAPAEPGPDVGQLADIFHLLGDMSRLKLLLACLEQSWPATELAAHCGVSPQAASHHLRLLKAARLLRAERKGRQIVYTAADEHVRHMLKDMIEHLAEEKAGQP